MKRIVLSLECVGLAWMAAWGAAIPASTAADREVAGLSPRTPWVTDAREIVNLGGADAGWRLAFTKVRTDLVPETDADGSVVTNKVYVDTPLDEGSAAWWSFPVPYDGLPSAYYYDVFYHERTFMLSPEQAAKNVRLAFEYIGCHYKVWINGQLAISEPQGAGFLETHDVTPYVHAGGNTIRIMTADRFEDDAQDGELRNWRNYPANAVQKGIRRPIYLELREKVAIERVAVRTKVTPEKVLEAFVVVTNATAAAVTVQVGGIGPSRTVAVPANGTAEVTLSETRPDAELWTPDNPHLEEVTVTLDGGRDAYRVRYGFREFSWVGTDHELRLNGHPFTLLRTTCWQDGIDPEAARSMMRMLKSRGVMGVRYPNGERKDFARFCDVADEEGFLVVSLAQSGWGAAYKTEAFWPRWRRLLSTMMLGSMNNPSVVCWGLSNEFGTVYGGGSVTNEANYATAVRQTDVGAWAQALDPTRPWTMFGEIEGRWHGREGPVAIRSCHYPLSVGSYTLPQLGRWYERGESGWQGVFTNDTVVSISEDLFHGFQDDIRKMARTSVGDRVYTFDGYVDAMWECQRVFADGYLKGRVGAWEPFNFYSVIATNPIFAGSKGSPYPKQFFSFTEYRRNVTAGTATSLTLRVFNRAFLPVVGDCRWRVSLDGVETASGVRHLSLAETEIAEIPFPVEAPSVDRIRPFTLTLELVSGGAILQSDSFVFCAVPALDVAAIPVPEGVALLSYDAASTLAGLPFPKGVFTTAAAAIGSNPKAIVVQGSLGRGEGQALDNWVHGGGRVLQLEPGRYDWCVEPLPESPYGVVDAHAFRRDASRMADLPEEAMRTWAEDGYVARLALEKPIVDATVIWETASAEGVKWADVAWIWRGRGGWLVSTLDVLPRLGHEPVAPHVLKSLFAELVNVASNPPESDVVLVGGTNAVAQLFRRYDAALTQVSSTEAAAMDLSGRVFVFDADGAPLPSAEKSLVRRIAGTEGARALVLGLGAEEDADFLGDLGIRWEDPLPEKRAPVPWNARQTNVVDQSRHFFTVRSPSGVMSGINNEDLFWWKSEKTWSYFRYLYTGTYPSFIGDTESDGGVTVPVAGEPVSAYFESVDTMTQIGTEPSAIGVREGPGRVVFSSVDFGNARYAARFPRKAFTVLKTLVNNLGGRTTVTASPANFTCLDLSPYVNSASVNGVPKATPQFPSAADYRYFPVNRSGWSVASENYCPVEEIPVIPLTYEGIPFLFTDPGKNGGRDILFSRNGAGQDVAYRVQLPRPLRAKRAHFLGWGMWKGSEERNWAWLSFGTNGVPQKMVAGEQYGNYWGNNPSEGKAAKQGVTVYDQPCVLPVDERGVGYSPSYTRVFLWTIENPDPETPITELDLSGCNALGIHAITVEELPTNDAEPSEEGYGGSSTITVSGLPETGSFSDLPMLVRFAEIRGFNVSQLQTPDASDLAFTSETGESLPWELEAFDPDSGALLAWVGLPIASNGVTFAAHWGRKTPEPHVASDVWKAYLGVWHLSDLSDATTNGYSLSVYHEATALTTNGVFGGCCTIAPELYPGATKTGSWGLAAVGTTNLALNGEFTVSGWMKHTGSAYYDHLFYRKNGTQSDFTGFAAELNATKLNMVDLYTTTKSPCKLSAAFTNDVWSHLALTFSNTTCIAYANGSPCAATTIVNASDNGLPFTFGNNWNGTAPSDCPWRGQMDELRLRKGVPSAAWLAAEYAAMADPGFLSYGAADVSSVGNTCTTPALSQTAAGSVESDGVRLSIAFVDGRPEPRILAPKRDDVRYEIQIAPALNGPWETFTESTPLPADAAFFRGVVVQP